MIDVSRERQLARLVGIPRVRLAQLLERLEPRERRMVVAAAVVLALIIVWLAIVDPVLDTFDRLDRSLALARRQAAGISELASRYTALSGQVAAAEHAASSDQGGASLFAQLESVAVPAVGRDHISSMNPSSRQVGDKLVEESVEMHVEGTGLRELLTLLHSIERSGRPMRLARISLKRQYKNPGLLDVNLAVTRLRPQ